MDASGYLEVLKKRFVRLDECIVASIEIPDNYLLLREEVKAKDYKYKLVNFDDEFGADWRNLYSVKARRCDINGDGYGRPTIRRLPDNFGSGFNNLLKLDLHGNRDLQLPDGFGSGLSQLQYLVLSYTNIQCLPNDFGVGWVELEGLDLNNNKITELPIGFGSSWTELRELHLYNNQLVNLPNDFGVGWVELEWLILSNNKITELPIGFGSSWAKLRTLYLNNNQLVNLPNDFGVGWVELEDLNLHNNNITELPRSITSINPGVYLYLDGNQLVKPPLEVCIKGIEAIKDYFQSLDDSVAVSSKRTKIILVGESFADVDAAKSSIEQFNPAGTARMLMTIDGGEFVFEHLYVSLDVCRGALDVPVQLELSNLPCTHANFKLALGEAILSHVILLGPEKQSFLKPAALRIPYNLHEAPRLTEIVGRCYNASENRWINVPTTLSLSAKGDRKLAEIEVNSTGMFVICLLLKDFNIAISESATEICPFEEELGITMRFDSGTFGNSTRKGILKANVFTKSALHALKCHGVSTSPILHIDIEGSDVPRKPVTIELTLQAEKPVDGQLKVFSANDCDFTDITDTLESKLHNNVVVFQVEHFSSYVCLWTPITVWTTIRTTIDLLKTYVARSIDVDFYLYARRIPRTPRDIFSCCVACSPNHDNEGVKKYFSDPEYEQVEKSKSLNGIYMGTLMDVGVVGEWKSRSLDPLILKFKSAKYCVTEKFQMIEKSEESSIGNKANYIVINGQQIGVKYGSIPYWGLPTMAISSTQAITEDDDSDKKEEDTDEGAPPCRYEATHNPRGICLIIANEKFEDGRKRAGTDKDVENITKTFKWLQFKVVTVLNCTAEQMREKLTEITKVYKADHDKYDMFACFILSHGDSGGKIEGIDEEFITELQIRDIFHGEKCGSLRDKPKLFFIQACRGANQDEVANQAGGAASVPDVMKKSGSEVASADFGVSNLSHFVFSFPTAPGHYAWRLGGVGSYYIVNLCELLQDNAQNKHLLEILKLLNGKMASETIELKEMEVIKTVALSAEKTDSLTKDLYFHPNVAWSSFKS